MTFYDEQPDGEPHGECAAEIARLTVELAAAQAREQEIREAMLSVLCDPEGVPCFDGSDGDRRVIAGVLQLSADHSALDAVIKAAIEDEKQNLWKAEIIDQLVIHFALGEGHDSDPRKAVTDLLQMATQMALDPLISSDAQKLVKQGRIEGMERAAKACDDAVIAMTGLTGSYADGCKAEAKSLACVIRAEIEKEKSGA